MSLGIGNQKDTGLKSYECRKEDLLFTAKLLLRKVVQICTVSFQQCMKMPSSLQSCQCRIVSLKNKEKLIS